ncbi:MAG: DUF2156 domain-containing protein [Phocaeicola sp.]
MLQFKAITLDDRSSIQSYTLKTPRRNCDLSFSNLFSWRFLYQTEFAIAEGFLLLRFWVDEELVYMMPIGEGNLANVLKLLIDDAAAQGSKLSLLGVCVDMKAEVEQAMPGQFTFSSERDYSDYIYLRSDLTTLSGKKYQPKRNHLNKFKKNYPDYQFKPLTPDLVPTCFELEEKWCKANNCAERAELAHERASMIAALTNMEALAITGGLLYVNNEIVAFTYGSPINQQTWDVCVEKADTEVEGSYAMINYEYAHSISEQYIYINREEDLGLEGLRKAKLSYYPEIILEKCIATQI